MSKPAQKCSKRSKSKWRYRFRRTVDGTDLRPPAKSCSRLNPSTSVIRLKSMLNFYRTVNSQLAMSVNNELAKNRDLQDRILEMQADYVQLNLEHAHLRQRMKSLAQKIMKPVKVAVSNALEQILSASSSMATAMECMTEDKLASAIDIAGDDSISEQASPYASPNHGPRPSACSIAHVSPRVNGHVMKRASLAIPRIDELHPQSLDDDNENHVQSDEETVAVDGDDLSTVDEDVIISDRATEVVNDARTLSPILEASDEDRSPTFGCTAEQTKIDRDTSLHSDYTEDSRLAGDSDVDGEVAHKCPSRSAMDTSLDSNVSRRTRRRAAVQASSSLVEPSLRSKMRRLSDPESGTTVLISEQPEPTVVGQTRRRRRRP